MIDMQQQTAEMILSLFFEFLAKDWLFLFWSSLSKKGLNLWRKLSFFGPLEWWRPNGTLLGLNVAH